VSTNLEIIVPVHNILERKTHLQRLLSLGYHEEISFILVVDSNLKEAETEVLNIVQNSSYPNSKVLSGDFKSPGLARNAGISLSQANWLCFLDSDDDIDLDLLNLLLRKAQDDSALLAIGGIRYRSNDRKTLQNYFLNSNLSILDNLALTPAFTRMIFNKSLLSERIFPAFRMAEDQCFILEVLSLQPRIYTEEIYFYTYNLGHCDQATKNLVALSDLVLSISHINSHLKNFKRDLRPVATTMIFRQAITYISTFKFFPNMRIFLILRILIKIFFLHPVSALHSLNLIFFHRPRSIDN
jgi:glycosyltransferase involved in cell wall biosynthesis